MTRFHAFAVLALGLLLAACGEAPPAPAASAPAAAPPPAAAPAAPAAATAADAPKPEVPSLKLALFEGGEYDLAAHRGKWVVVNFWATWCNPCLKEIPELAELDHSREDIEVIGLAFEEIEPADMRAFLAKRPIPYPIAVLDTFNPPADFEVPRGLPMTYLIAPDGKVARKYLGPVTAAALLQVVDAKPGA